MLSMVLLLSMLHYLSMIHYMSLQTTPHSFMLHSHTLLVHASLSIHDPVACPSIVQCLSIEGLVKSNGNPTVLYSNKLS
ncbi:hypothetical protein B0O80DRAFT_457841 [Mortierella sp. GBAus27b]|nr:hypothetical protein B0O80DRAFT_457841 [Mortierella sp. GBAus27b]